MKESSISNFGLLIAYLVPGFTALWGASFASASLRRWLATSPADPPTIGGFLYVTIASIAVGLTVSTFRWLVIDTIHHRTRLLRPAIDFARLGENVGAFNILVEGHYRYYQFYANMVIALTCGHLARRSAVGFWTAPLGWPDAAFLILAAVFFAGSRDTLRKYYTRVDTLLAPAVRNSRARGSDSVCGPTTISDRKPCAPAEQSHQRSQHS